MARKIRRKSTRVHISPARAGRLYRLLKGIAGSSTGRADLLKHLRVGIRTFYRDVDLLRECGINVEIKKDGYRLSGTLSDALHRLPFPDPELTFGDAEVLRRGRTSSHAKIQSLFARVAKTDAKRKK